MLNPHQGQQASGKGKHVAALQACNKALFHRAQLGALEVLHRQRSVADDSADVASVSPRQSRVGHPPNAVFVGLDTRKIRVVGQRAAALANKIKRPLPGVVAQVPVSMGAPHFVQQLAGHKTAAQRNRYQVLHQHIQRCLRRVARLNLAQRQRVAHSGRLYEFQAVGGHQRHA